MGRKDAAGVKSTPVDQYRKQIGKQDWKKSKKEMKSLKAQSDLKKSGLSAKDIVLITGTILALLAGLYGWLFWYLSKDQIKEDSNLKEP